MDSQPSTSKSQSPSKPPPPSSRLSSDEVYAAAEKEWKEAPKRIALGVTGAAALGAFLGSIAGMRSYRYNASTEGITRARSGGMNAPMPPSKAAMSTMANTGAFALVFFVIREGVLAPAHAALRQSWPKKVGHRDDSEGRLDGGGRVIDPVFEGVGKTALAGAFTGAFINAIVRRSGRLLGGGVTFGMICTVGQLAVNQLDLIRIRFIASKQSILQDLPDDLSAELGAVITERKELPEGTDRAPLPPRIAKALARASELDSPATEAASTKSSPPPPASSSEAAPSQSTSSDPSNTKSTGSWWNPFVKKVSDEEYRDALLSQLKKVEKEKAELQEATLKEARK